MDKLLCYSKPTEEEKEMMKMVGSEVDKFVRQRWVESEWETAWFVNPPVSILFKVVRFHPTVTYEAHKLHFSCIPAFFVTQRIQSVKDLSHIHVFARRKSAEEIARGEF